MPKVYKLLKKLGTPKLMRLYGEAEVESIAAILEDRINEIKLVELIKTKYGSQLLSEKNIRLAVLSGLSDAEKGYVLDGKILKERVLSKNEKERLANLRWGRKQSSSHRLLQVLELDETFLPDNYEAPPSEEEIKPSLYLFPHQKRLKDNFIRKLSDNANRLLVHMPTGAGKTRTSIEGIIDFWKANADRGSNIVWLAHSEELCEQALETFSKIWKVRGDSPIKVCRLWGEHKLNDFSEGNCFIVAGFQKLYNLISTTDDKQFRALNALKNKTSIIIVDEAHKAVAPTYKASIDYLYTYSKTKLIGLTATPGRSSNDIFVAQNDSETSQLVDFFDGNKIGLTDEDNIELKDPIGFLQDEGFLSRINRKRVTTNIELDLTETEKRFVSNFLDLPKSVLSKLADNDERNALILGEIAGLIRKGRQIIVFALSVQHAHLITDLLNLQGVKAKCVDGNTPTSERNNTILEYKAGSVQVLVNFGVLTTGFDAPNTNAVVITRPTASIVLYSQMIGRGIRGPKVGGNEVCDLVDLEDNLVGFPSEQQAFNYFNQAWS
jgi:superfamily II DNA or RNA helicase